MMKHLPGTETHFKCYHCFNKASAWRQHSPSLSLSFFKPHLKEQCHVLSDHLTQSSESPSLLSDHLCLPLFFSVVFSLFFFSSFCNQTHTTTPEGLALYDKKHDSSLIAKRRLSVVSFRGNKSKVSAAL